MKQLRNSPAGDDHQSGQALIEAALVLVVAILLLAGLVEFGWAYFRYLAMQSAAGEGAVYGIIHPDWHDSGDNPDPNNIAFRARNESRSPLLDWSTAGVQVDAEFVTPGNLITVTVTYDHELITPLLAPFVSDGSITLRATAVQKIISPLPEP